MNIALFGGTFDPVHIGHIKVAETVLQKLPIDEVWFVPAGVSPQKSEVMFTFWQRIEFIKEAIRGNERFWVYENDIRDYDKSYTIYLLQEVKERYPDYNFSFIIGADNVTKLQTWREHAKLVTMVDFIVISRETDDVAEWQGLEYFHRLRFVDMPVVNVSSSEIREIIRRQVRCRG